MNQSHRQGLEVIAWPPNTPEEQRHAIAFGVDDAVRRWPRFRAPVLTGCAAVLAALGTGTVHQLGYWRDSVTAMQRAVAVADRLEQRWGIRTQRMLPHLNLGDALVDRGDYAEAEYHLGLALRFDPNDHRTLNLMACSVYSQGRAREASPAGEEHERGAG